MDEKEQRRLDNFRNHLQGKLQLQQATIAFEHAALKPLFLLNGGALVLSLAFLGAILSSAPGGRFQIHDTEMVWWAIFLWGSGLVLAAVCTGLGYLHQLNFFRESNQNTLHRLRLDDGKEEEAAESKTQAKKDGKRAHRQRNWAYGVWFASLAAFLGGIVLGLLGLGL